MLLLRNYNTKSLCLLQYQNLSVRLGFTNYKFNNKRYIKTKKFFCLDPIIKDTFNKNINFNYDSAAYNSKSTKDILRSIIVLKICKINFFVKNVEQLVNFSRKVFGDNLVDKIIEHSFFKQFCAGKNIFDVKKLIDKHPNNIGGYILDYAVEVVDNNDIFFNHVISQNKYEYNMNKIIESIHTLKNIDNKNKFIAIKITSLCNPNLLKKISILINKINNLFTIIFDYNKTGKISVIDFKIKCLKYFNFDISYLLNKYSTIKSSGYIDIIDFNILFNPIQINHLPNAKHNHILSNFILTHEELQLYKYVNLRLDLIASESVKSKVRLLFDAEQTYFQPAIDMLVQELQQKYNKIEFTSKPIIFNTIQCYLKTSLIILNNQIKHSQIFSYHLGTKLVRGAYLHTENIISKQKGSISPIHDNINQTHKSFDSAFITLLYHRYKGNQNEIFLCTHNKISIQKALNYMTFYNIKKCIHFAQLFGMKDHITYNIHSNGYSVFKYIPYGEIKKVIPYLLRRAQENMDITQNSHEDITLLKKELKRRLFNYIKIP